MTRATLPSLLVLLVGCAPQQAEVSGTWFTWLAANSSPTVAEEAIKDIEEKATIFECTRGWDRRADEWDQGYIGPREDDDWSNDRYVGGDCNPDDSDCDADALAAECEPIDALEWYTFLQTDGYYGLSGTLEPWRTEAFLNGEGDLQVTTHHRLGSGEDFRFAFSIKPDFAPVLCTTDDSGAAAIEYVDGADWVEKWSEDEDGYSIYYLNAGGYQNNPNDDEIFWYFTTDWNSGYGLAKFSAEEFSSDPGFYFESGGNRESWDEDQYSTFIDDVTESSDLWQLELSDVAGANFGDDNPAFFHKIESNEWRPIDIRDDGLDGWVEMQTSWVRIKDGSKFEKGGSVSGDYQILYNGTESGSQLMVTGSFSIDKLKEDTWAYPIFEDDKREENGTPFCGGAAVP